MAPKENFQIENEKPKKRKGIRFGPFALFLLAIVLLASIATIVILAVFFVEQGQEISDLQNEVNVLKPNSSVSTAAPTVAPTTTPTTVSATDTSELSSSTTSSLPEVIRESYRLPSDFVPIHYEIFLQVFLPFNAAEENNTGAFTTYGETKIDVVCENSSNILILHAWNLTIYSSRVVSGNALHQELQIENVQKDELRHFFIIRLAQNLTKGETYRVEFKYTGLIVNENQGLYRSKYTLPNGETRWLAASQFQPYKARRVFPCFDEPGIRATFDIAVKHDSRFTGTYSIRKRISSETVPGSPNWTETRFERTVRMPAYLLAFLVSDFERNGTVTPEGLDFGVLSRKDALKDADFSKVVGIKMTEHFGELFNMSYTKYNSKLDMVAVPDFDAGAMENWGLIVYREVMMLYRQGVSSVRDKKQVAAVVAHELAHQWFGNPVTCSWWSEAFLNEGFASFLEAPLVEAALPQWQLGKTFTILENRVAFDADAYETAVPLYNPKAEKPSEIENMFGRITYQKGASVIRMIEGVMDTTNFYAALTTYLAERSEAGGITTHKDLLDAFTDQMAKSENLPEITVDYYERFNEWITTNGFPLVTVRIHREENKNKLVVKQERFLLGNANTSDTANNRAWNIPFTFVVKESNDSASDLFDQQNVTRTPVWLNKTGASGEYDIDLPVAPEWVLANVQSRGYYRVNYEEANWEALTMQLDLNHSAIHMFSRVQLIDDAFNLARKGAANYEIPIGLIKYLSSETEYPPWSTAIDSLQYIDSMIGGSTDVLRQFMQKILEVKYQNDFWKSEEVWREDEMENYQELMLRLTVVESSCYHEVESCSSEASKELKEWKDANGSSRIDPHFKGQIFCYGIRNGSREDFDYLYWQFTQADVHTTKLNILEGLACSKEDELVQSNKFDFIYRVLNMTLDRNIVRSQDASYVLRYASKFPAGHLLAWNFLKAHWKDLPQSSRDNMISDVAGKFNTQEKLDDVTAFYTSLGSDIPEKIAFEGTLARIRSNILWMSQYKEAVVNALQEDLL